MKKDYKNKKKNSKPFFFEKKVKKTGKKTGEKTNNKAVKKKAA